ncbi:peptidyl-prolyl cis-trans isomerase B (cyclophilin B) [Pseudonocardia endophytica]|uniref:Peptidyl-prolyl cis-trans isomerase n=2 Tax=Pseudonocardia endophytica TaxID=401976 RepID=A0A4R1HQF2_PSEEN|nr:peptidyl-prolyl cis-trans isomerase B (cyclophilin B) [Pseudonocardia endophytica]
MRRDAAKRKLANQQKRREEQLRRRKRNTTIASIVTVVVVIAAGVGVYLYATAPEQLGPDTSGVATAPLPKRPQALPASVDCTYPAAEAAAKPVSPPANGPVSTNGTVAANLDTSAGPIDMTLDRSLAPCTVNSFVNLAQKGFYNDTTCHRITTGQGLQVLQCGDPTGSGSGGPGYKFDDEVFPGLKYGRGLLAMANSGPNTNGSQFFMIYGDAELPPQYTVFGSIGPEGLSTLTDIGKAGVGGGGDDGAPATPVQIRTATAS